MHRYNDEFPMRADLERERDTTLEFIDQMNFPPTSRLWKKADLFTAMIELHSAVFKPQKQLSPTAVASVLSHFYSRVDKIEIRGDPKSDPSDYYKAALQATNDRSSRITRDEIARRLLETSFSESSVA